MTLSGRICIACAAVAFAAIGCSERIGRGWDWNRMRNQPRYEPYRGSAFFADGKAMQLPPVGTVSRERGAESVTRFVVNDAVIAQGAVQYHVYCAVCHGDRGDGVSIVASNMDPPRPPSLIAPPVSLMPARVIATAIANGAGTMPSFAAELAPADRQAVAAYVRMLQSAATPDAPPAPRGR